MSKTLIISIVIALIAAYNLWPLQLIPGLFYKGIGISFLLMSLYVMYKEKGRPAFKYGVAFFMLTINNLMDELLFNPEKFGWNEYAFLGITIAYLIISIHYENNRKNGRQKYF
jgi:uncharacterized membrane protein